MSYDPGTYLNSVTVLLERIARDAHRGQTDKLGRDYCDYHLARVAAAVQPNARPIAWGHDLLEDTAETPQSLYDKGVPLWVIEEIQLLTIQRGDTYQEFVSRVCFSERVLAIHVKLADVLDHYIDLDKLPHDDRLRLTEKYNGVRTMLRTALVLLSSQRNRQSDNSFLRGYML